VTEEKELVLCTSNQHGSGQYYSTVRVTYSSDRVFVWIRIQARNNTLMI
jgi:hypothetical protein